MIIIYLQHRGTNNLHVCLETHVANNIRYFFVKKKYKELTYGAVISDEVISTLAVILEHPTADAVTLAAPAVVAVDVRALVIIVVAAEVDVIRQQRVTGVG